MANITILFGNGLGRAINNETFQISTGFREACNNLPVEAKTLIAPNALKIPNN
jgi:hypothetical protein